MRHTTVREAAVIGAPDPELGQRPVAYVTARGVHAPDTLGLVEFVYDGLGRPVPSLTVKVVDAMPMTPTGKISKAQLLEQETAR